MTVAYYEEQALYKSYLFPLLPQGTSMLIANFTPEGPGNVAKPPVGTCGT